MSSARVSYMRAVEYGCLDVLQRQLTSTYIDARALNRALLAAVRKGFAEGVRAMLPLAGSTLDMNKLLHDACAAGNIGVLHELTDTTDTTRLPGKIDESTFHIALSCDEAVALYLVERCAHALDLTAALICAANGGHLSVVRALLAQGAHPDSHALEAACAGSHADVIALLLQSGAVATKEAWWMAQTVGGAQALQALQANAPKKRDTCTFFNSPMPHLVPMPRTLLA